MQRNVLIQRFRVHSWTNYGQKQFNQKLKSMQSKKNKQTENEKKTTFQNLNCSLRMTAFKYSYCESHIRCRCRSLRTMTSGGAIMKLLKIRSKNEYHSNTIYNFFFHSHLCCSFNECETVGYRIVSEMILFVSRSLFLTLLNMRIQC